MTWDAATARQLGRIPMPLLRTTSVNVTFVAGTHSLLANVEDGLALVDADTGRWRVVRRLIPPFRGWTSGDGRTVLVERTSDEQDLWLMEFRRP